jgi:DNA polymerase I-like protein with 3'-5' exonuclease and polymerase domains
MRCPVVDAGLPVQIVLLLHDGIWFSCPEDRVTVTRVTEEIQKTMENSVRLSVPLKTELGWHRYEEYPAINPGSTVLCPWMATSA